MHFYFSCVKYQFYIHFQNKYNDSSTRPLDHFNPVPHWVTSIPQDTFPFASIHRPLPKVTEPLTKLMTGSAGYWPTYGVLISLGISNRKHEEIGQVKLSPVSGGPAPASTLSPLLFSSWLISLFNISRRLSQLSRNYLHHYSSGWRYYDRSLYRVWPASQAARCLTEGIILPPVGYRFYSHVVNRFS